MRNGLLGGGKFGRQTLAQFEMSTCGASGRGRQPPPTASGLNRIQGEPAKRLSQQVTLADHALTPSGNRGFLAAGDKAGRPDAEPAGHQTMTLPVLTL